MRALKNINLFSFCETWSLEYIPNTIWFAFLHRESDWNKVKYEFTMHKLYCFIFPCGCSWQEQGGLLHSRAYSDVSRVNGGNSPVVGQKCAHRQIVCCGQCTISFTAVLRYRQILYPLLWRNLDFMDCCPIWIALILLWPGRCLGTFCPLFLLRYLLIRPSSLLRGHSIMLLGVYSP